MKMNKVRIHLADGFVTLFSDVITQAIENKVNKVSNEERTLINSMLRIVDVMYLVSSETVEVNNPFTTAELSSRLQEVFDTKDALLGYSYTASIFKDIDVIELLTKAFERDYLSIEILK